MRLRLIHLAILLSAALLLLSGCSAGITAVEELPEMAVTAGTGFDTLQLPTQVGVTFKNGASGKAAVKWDIAEWVGEEVHESITVTGKVAGAKELAILRVVVPHPKPSSLGEGTICIDAQLGMSFDEIELPAELDVTFSDGSTGKAPVAWETASWSGKPLERSIRLEGHVEHIRTPMRLVIAALPHLTPEELANNGLASLMDDKLNGDPAFYQVTWSPGRERLAFTVGTDELGDDGQLYVWTKGTPSPIRPKGVLQQLSFYHGLSWSFDSKRLAVHDMMSAYTAMYIVDGSSLEIVQTMETLGIGYWSPDTPEYLVASSEGGEKPTFPFPLSRTTDLVLINAANGDQRTLLKADAETFYTVEGWKAPGQAQYTRFFKDDTAQEGLVISTRP